MSDLLVEMTGITKDFPGVHALADVARSVIADLEPPLR